MDMVLRTGRLVGCEGVSVLEGAYIVIEGDRIADVTRSEPQVGSYERIDLSPYTVLPGLIDAHTHLAMDPFAPVDTQGTDDSLGSLLLRALLHAERALSKGTTTCRDCGASSGIIIDLARAERAGLLPRVPRILAAGHNICITGGHGHRMGREADGPDEVRKAVRGELKAGADFIKVMATGGVMTAGVEMGSTQFTVEELKAASEEAHKAGKRIAAHAQASEGILNALKAGIDTIEHGSYINDEALSIMKDRGAFFVATLIAAVQEYEHRMELPGFVQRKIVKHVERERDAVRRAIAAGVNMACGTDSGCPFTDHGSLPDQMEILVALGMTPLQAIETATSGSARALGVETNVGSIKVGLLADIIAVEGRPDEDIMHIRNLRMVIKGGRIIVRE